MILYHTCCSKQWDRNTTIFMGKYKVSLPPIAPHTSSTLTIPLRHSPSGLKHTGKMKTNKTVVIDGSLTTGILCDHDLSFKHLPLLNALVSHQLLVLVACTHTHTHTNAHTKIHTHQNPHILYIHGHLDTKVIHTQWRVYSQWHSLGMSAPQILQNFRTAGTLISIDLVVNAVASIWSKVLTSSYESNYLVSNNKEGEAFKMSKIIP